MLYALWALVILIAGMFALLAFGSFMGSWLQNIRRASTVALDDDATYGEPDPTAGRGSDVLGGRRP